MILNTIEKAMMNNPIRALLQRHFEARRLLGMGGPMSGGLALEVGCGRGVGAEIILDRFGAERLEAFDLDERQVAIARRRLAKYSEKVKLWRGSVTEIPADDDHYDAVFDFAIVHHVPDWRNAVREIHRVLKPGARFYCEEVLKHFIHRPTWRRLLDHPMQDRFSHSEFLDELRNTGFEIIAEQRFAQDLGWSVSAKT